MLLQLAPREPTITLSTSRDTLRSSSDSSCLTGSQSFTVNFSVGRLMFAAAGELRIQQSCRTRSPAPAAPRLEILTAIAARAWSSLETTAAAAPGRSKSSVLPSRSPLLLLSPTTKASSTSLQTPTPTTQLSIVHPRNIYRPPACRRRFGARSAASSCGPCAARAADTWLPRDIFARGYAPDARTECRRGR